MSYWSGNQCVCGAAPCWCYQYPPSERAARVAANFQSHGHVYGNQSQSIPTYQTSGYHQQTSPYGIPPPPVSHHYPLPPRNRPVYGDNRFTHPSGSGYDPRNTAPLQPYAGANSHWNPIPAIGYGCVGGYPVLYPYSGPFPVASAPYPQPRGRDPTPRPSPMPQSSGLDKDSAIPEPRCRTLTPSPARASVDPPAGSQIGTEDGLLPARNAELVDTPKTTTADHASSASSNVRSSHHSAHGSA